LPASFLPQGRLASPARSGPDGRPEQGEAADPKDAAQGDGEYQREYGPLSSGPRDHGLQATKQRTAAAHNEHGPK
jgi:hypothetical protein